MNTRNILRQDVHTRYLGVCTDNHGLLDATDGGTQALGALGASVADVIRWSTERQRRLEDERAAAETCRTRRRNIHDGLKAVVTVSRFVALDEGAAKIVVPPRRSGDGQRFVDARAILDKVTPYTTAFLKQGLPQNVLKDLPAQIDGLLAAKAAQAKARTQRVAANQSLRDALKAGDQAIDLLHTIVVNTPNVDPNIVTQFRLAKRIGPMKANAGPGAAGGGGGANPSTPKVA